jgi:isoleucyl-tRNA synthetase
MVNPTIDYIEVRDEASGKNYILAQGRLSGYSQQGVDSWSVVRKFLGKELVGLRYKPLFSYFSHRTDAFRVIAEEAVSVDEGTGLVHSAPGFGELDFYAAQRENIELVCPVDKNGQFTDEIPEYRGKFVKEADKDIISRLQAQGSLFHRATLRHRYPFCWRSDTPLIYRAVKTWFVAVEKIKPQLLEANSKIHWTPSHIQSGRFGKWLEGARDWAISRNRYWGTPIPIWRADDGEIKIMGSVAELEKITQESVVDLHRHFIDDIKIEENGKTFTRVPEVFDCWFESGSMPFAQNHYPFENKELFDKGFPADFIAEGLDQTRGWFYTLTVLSAALQNSPAFKNVIVNGIVLAADGAKMSKRLRNYPDPLEVVHKYGADAIRLYLLHSPVVHAEDLCFTETGVELVLRQILIPWWNAFSFFNTYARIYSFSPEKQHTKSSVAIDRWILSLLHKLIHEVEEGMGEYNLSHAVEPFIAFIDQLTNWYIRRCRRRFWEAEDTSDRRMAFTTLYEVLTSLTKIAASFVPFTSEAIYRHLRHGSMAESVHLCDFPHYDKSLRDEHLEEVMAYVQTAVSLGHALRKEKRLKVRQPLAAAYIASSNEKILAFLSEEKQLIADELNVKEVHFSSKEEDYVLLEAKPNFRVLGKKVGSKMKAVQAAIAALTSGEREKLLSGDSIILNLEGEEFVITPEDVAVERKVKEGLVAANIGAITIALDTMLNDALVQEALAREIVNKLNTMRREADFAVTDRIVVFVDSTSTVQDCFGLYGNYIAEEVLAKAIHFSSHTAAQAWDLNGEPASIAIEKIVQ